MSDALGAALAGSRLREGRSLPRGARARAGEFQVPVSLLVAAKLTVRAAMREQGVSNVALAARLGLTEAVVRRLVDPHYASRLGCVVNALSMLGCGLIIEDRKLVAA